MNEKDSIIVVSGLPRSGTSMMMKVLEAGGLEIVTDNIRKADDDNPRGYYEFEKVKKLKQDASWLDDCSGKVIKVISQLLYDLPGDKYYKILFLRRKMGEILASQKVMLERLGRVGAGISDEKMAEKFQGHLVKVENWLQKQDNMDVLFLSYNEIMEGPSTHFSLVNSFLAGVLNEKKMADSVDVSLYRQREKAR